MGAAIAVRGGTLDGDPLIAMADATVYAGKAERRFHRRHPIRWSARGDVLVHLHRTSLPATRRTDTGGSPYRLGSVAS
ncbi:hypothetical protein GCM10027452_02960 [Micromonospora halotolerans]